MNFKDILLIEAQFEVQIPGEGIKVNPDTLRIKLRKDQQNPNRRIGIIPWKELTPEEQIALKAFLQKEGMANYRDKTVLLYLGKKGYNIFSSGGSMLSDIETKRQETINKL